MNTSLYPFQSHWRDVGPGVRMQYIDEGKGEPVVMVHGNPTWSFMYRDLVKTLSGSFRCVVPDHIGMGLSDKPVDNRYSYTLSRRVEDLDRLLDKLEIDKGITLIAHDWGGMIAMSWAVKHPSRVKRIVLMNTAAFFPPPTKPLPKSLVWSRGALGALLVRGFNFFVLGAARWCATRRPLSPEVREGFIMPYDSWANRIAVHRFVQDIPVQPGDPAYDVVEETQRGLWQLSSVPLMVVWGGKDFVFDMEFYEEWRKRFPHATFRLIPDAGHYVLEDAPEAIGMIRDFLVRSPAPAVP